MYSNDDNLILVDAHVHMHSNFKPENFFKAAFDNFRKFSENYGNPKITIGVLCLTESKNESAFQLLKKIAVCKGIAGHFPAVKQTIDQTEEEVSLKVTSEQQDIVMLIAGRQIVTRENLEVLALGSLSDFEEQNPIDRLITQIAEDGAIPIVPWGFGKWLGKRGKRLKDIFNNNQLPRFFIGDNGNRPKFWPRPSLFGVAKKNKIINMPGSDPLPFAYECRRPGRYGFAIRSAMDLDKPWNDLKAKLSDPATKFEYFGELESPFRFLRNQLAMQYHKRFCG
jgi:hypothetical protein